MGFSVAPRQSTSITLNKSISYFGYALNTAADEGSRLASDLHLYFFFFLKICNIWQSDLDLFDSALHSFMEPTTGSPCGIGIVGMPSISGTIPNLEQLERFILWVD